MALRPVASHGHMTWLTVGVEFLPMAVEVELRLILVRAALLAEFHGNSE